MAERILVGVDGSEGSIHAVRWAVEEALTCKAVQEPTAVWQSPYHFGEELLYPLAAKEGAAGAKEQLAEAVTDAVGTVPTVTGDQVIIDGDSGETLCGQPADAGLLLVGSRGRGGFVRLILGSVSSACAHHRRCPIVIVPTPHPDIDAPTGT